MKLKTKKYLYDIQSAIQLIEVFMEGVATFERYENDLKTKSAVERQLGIIGEAVNKLVQVEPSLSLSHARQIIDFRNRLIHAYDHLDDAIVWLILQKYLPTLQQEVSDWLRK